jgi:hypothetical protein
MSRRLSPILATLSGVALVAAFVGWKLAGSTSARDAETMCNAEGRSGLWLDRDMASLSGWIRVRLTTPEGGQWFEALRDAPLTQRAGDLRSRARAAGLAACPLAESYARLRAVALYRADLQQACSRFTYPGMEDLPVAMRVQRLAEWLETQAATEQAHVLAATIHQDASRGDAKHWLRSAAAEAGVYTCDVATMVTAEAPLACAAR